MQIIACQLNIVWEDKPANRRRVRELLAPIEVRAGALIVLPEMFATGFSMNVGAVQEETDDGGTERFCAELAQEYGAYVLAGVVRRASSDPQRGLNQAVAYSPAGEEIARYTKMHPMTVAGEADRYDAGEAVVTFAIGSFIVAPFICYDLRFPEIFRMAAVQEAHVIPVIANWPAVREHHWRTLLTARAIENQAYVIGVNRTGSSPEIEYPGRSLVIDPRGQIIAEVHDEETALVAQLEIEPLLEYREKFPALADRRCR